MFSENSSFCGTIHDGNISIGAKQSAGESAL